ncbi:hypothetical protein K9F62_10295 [Desulfovibrio sp. JY]|nr:hypothetical protein K9F62_10295 [Desulfovibrio sp. JY]
MLRLLRLRQLRLAGYPFAADSLPLDLWEDLGALETYIQSKKPRLF